LASGEDGKAGHDPDARGPIHALADQDPEPRPPDASGALTRGPDPDAACVGFGEVFLAGPTPTPFPRRGHGPPLVPSEQPGYVRIPFTPCIPREPIRLRDSRVPDSRCGWREIPFTVLRLSARSASAQQTELEGDARRPSSTPMRRSARRAGPCGPESGGRGGRPSADDDALAGITPARGWCWDRHRDGRRKTGESRPAGPRVPAISAARSAAIAGRIR